MTSETQKTETKLNLLSLAKRVDGIEADLSALADHVHNGPKDGDAELMQRVRFVLDKYYHNDRPA